MLTLRSFVAGVVLLACLLLGAVPHVQAQSDASLHLALGNPSGATTSTANSRGRWW